MARYSGDLSRPAAAQSMLDLSEMDEPDTGPNSSSSAAAAAAHVPVPVVDLTVSSPNLTINIDSLYDTDDGTDLAGLIEPEYDGSSDHKSTAAAASSSSSAAVGTTASSSASDTAASSVSRSSATATGHSTVVPQTCSIYLTRTYVPPRLHSRFVLSLIAIPFDRSACSI